MSKNFYCCTNCGDVLYRSDRPEKCYNCRTGDSELSEYPLFEEIEP